jgi:hypothetical protein
MSCCVGYKLITKAIRKIQSCYSATQVSNGVPTCIDVLDYNLIANTKITGCCVGIKRKVYRWSSKYLEGGLMM